MLMLGRSVAQSSLERQVPKSLLRCVWGSLILFWQRPMELDQYLSAPQATCTPSASAGLIDSTAHGGQESAEEPAEDDSPARSHRSGRSEPLSTWIASKLTPNRLSKVDSPPSQLEFREMRDRTIVTAGGKPVRSPSSSSGVPARFLILELDKASAGSRSSVRVPARQRLVLDTVI